MMNNKLKRKRRRRRRNRKRRIWRRRRGKCWQSFENLENYQLNKLFNTQPGFPDLLCGMAWGQLTVLSNYMVLIIVGFNYK